MMKLNSKEIAVVGMMTALLEAAKAALNALPNVELVSLLIILFTLFFGGKVLYAIAAFIVIEGMIFGFHVWWISYLYVWPLLAFVTWIFRRQESVWVFAAISGVFGLAFGALSSIPYYVIGGWSMGFSWWIAGIPYDLIHGISNFVLCMILFVPIRKVMRRQKIE